MLAKKIDQKILGPKIFVPITFLIEIIWVKKILSLNFFRQKKFLVSRNVGHQIFVKKKLD